jgi:CheY-like chemotaxis protein
MPRILLVEDNEMNRDMLSRRLGRKGFEVAIVGDGLQGLEAARSDSFDLILMDLSLPGIDGWEATRRLKADPATRAIPIIALTAHAMAGDRQRAIEAGCDDYDIKPVDFPRLLTKIEAVLSHRGSRMPLDTTPAEPDDRRAPGLLRHDLIGPLFRILGYCELLAEDAEALGRSSRAQSLLAIRGLGNEIRRVIDQALLGWSEPDRPVDLEALVAGVLTPAHAIIHACDALEEASGQAPDRESFLEDLDRIRKDAALLIAMVWQASADPAKTPG